MESIAGELVQGVSTLLVAFLAWKWGNVTSEKASVREAKRAHYQEQCQLYEGIFSLFERGISQQLQGEPFTLLDEFTRTNAKIRLHAPDAIIESYHEASSLLEKWSSLHASASPRRMRAGDATYTLIQSPDPTQKFQAPARQAHDDLQRALKNLVAKMREELNQARL